MKRIFTIFLFFILVVSAHSEFKFPNINNYTVGTQPMYISIDDYGQIHVLCLGLDLNYNGAFDDGDEAPSWWVSDGLKFPLSNGAAFISGFQKVKDFAFVSLGFPVRACFDYDNDLMFVNENYQVASYRISTYELVDNAIANINASAISKDGDYLYLTVTPYSNEGMVIKYNYITKTPIDTITNLTYPRQTLPYWNGSLAVLEENNFGTNYSKIHLYDVSGEEFLEFKEINVGDVANHIAIKGNNLYVTMNGSNEIKIIDLNTRVVTDSIKLPTSGYNGPRETAIFGNSDDFRQNQIFTTSYNGYLYEIRNGVVYDSVTTHGKTESIIMPDKYNGNIMAVTNCNQTVGYSSDTVVTLFSESMAVEDKQSNNHVNIYPNPAIDNFNINLYADDGNIANISIVNSKGVNVYKSTKQINDGKIQFNLSDLNLSTGTYIINTSINNKVYISKLLVSK